MDDEDKPETIIQSAQYFSLVAVLFWTAVVGSAIEATWRVVYHQLDITILDITHWNIECMAAATVNTFLSPLPLTHRVIKFQ